MIYFYSTRKYRNQNRACDILLTDSEYKVLAYQIMKSEVFAWDRNSYLVNPCYLTHG